MTTYDQIANPWKRQTKLALEKSVDDKLSNMDRHEKIVLRRELELCLERETYGQQAGTSHLLSADNPAACIAKGIYMMHESRVHQNEKNESIKQIEDVLSKLPQYNKYEMNDKLHELNLETVRLEMEFNSNAKQAIGASDVDLIDIVDEERKIKQKISEKNLEIAKVKQEQRDKFDKILGRDEASKSADKLFALQYMIDKDPPTKRRHTIRSRLEYAYDTDQIAPYIIPTSCTSKTDSTSITKAAVAGVTFVAGVGVAAKSGIAAKAGVIGLALLKGGDTAASVPSLPSVPMPTMTQQQLLTKMPSAPSVPTNLCSNSIQAPQDMSAATGDSGMSTTAKGVIGAILGGGAGLGGIALAQNVMELEEEEKLTTGETIATVGVCAVGGAVAIVSAPAIATGAVVVGVSSIIGGFVQYLKKHG